MYDRNLTEASKSALVEVCSALSTYRDDFALAGGWALYFLTKEHFDHCGSKDIDLVLKPSVMMKYESIRKTVERLGMLVVGQNRRNSTTTTETASPTELTRRWAKASLP